MHTLQKIGYYLPISFVVEENHISTTEEAIWEESMSLGDRDI
jgi:hypothetical protein